MGSQTNTDSELTDDGKPWEGDSLLTGWSGSHHIVNEDRQQAKRDSIQTKVSCYLGARRGGEEKRREDEEKKKRRRRKEKIKPRRGRKTKQNTSEQ